MEIKKDKVYTDWKYNCDLVVQEIMDSVVLIQDLDTGNSHVYEREEFEADKKRFTEKQ